MKRFLFLLVALSVLVPGIALAQSVTKVPAGLTPANQTLYIVLIGGGLLVSSAIGSLASLFKLYTDSKGGTQCQVPKEGFSQLHAALHYPDPEDSSKDRPQFSQKSHEDTQISQDKISEILVIKLRDMEENQKFQAASLEASARTNDLLEKLNSILGVNSILGGRPCLCNLEEEG